MSRELALEEMCALHTMLLHASALNSALARIYQLFLTIRFKFTSIEHTIAFKLQLKVKVQWTELCLTRIGG